MNSTIKEKELIKSDLKTKKRKRSYSGIELPSPGQEIDDFENII